MTIISAKRDRLRWTQHRKVQAGEKGNETLTATHADIADGSKELADLFRWCNDARVDFFNTAFGWFPFRRVERIFGQATLSDGVSEDVVEDTTASAEIIRRCDGAIELECQHVEDLADDPIVL